MITFNYYNDCFQYFSFKFYLIGCSHKDIIILYIMTESINFVCNICKFSFPTSERATRNKRCILCHKESERKRRTTSEYQQIKKIWNMDNEDKIKENKKEYLVKKRNEKYGYTEEKIKEIDDQWNEMQVLINDYLHQINYQPIIYTKSLTPKLKELYMKPFLFLKDEKARDDAIKHHKSLQMIVKRNQTI